MSTFTQALVEVCRAELQVFKNGKLKEDHQDVYQRVGDYWRSIPVPGIDGRTKQKDSKGGLYNPAWSAAFISFAARQAGAGAAFHYSQAHCHYVEVFRKAAAAPALAYVAVDPYTVAPKVGDIVCSGREYAKKLTFKQAALAYQADGFYPSHSDIVVQVDAAAGFIVTIGGNVDSSVKEKRLQISDNGRLLDRMDGPTSLPWLALLRCQR